MTGADVKDPVSPEHGSVEAPRVSSPIGAEELFRSHASFVAGLLRRLGIAERDVADVVQETFLLAHRKGGFVPGRAKPRTWLAAIAVRLAAQHRRRRRPDLAPSIVEEAMTPAADPAEDVELREALHRVDRALDALTFAQRVVFVLYEVEGHGCTAIADTLGLPVGTVYSRLHKARELFRRAHARLGDEEVR